MKKAITNTFNKIRRYGFRNRYAVKRLIFGLAICLPLPFVLYTYAQRKNKEVSNNKTVTTTVGYLIAFSTLRTTPKTVDVIQITFKITGHWLPLIGMGNDSINTELFVIPAAGEFVEELTMKLQAIPEVHNVTVIAFSKPAKASELVAVRKLFAAYYMDASKVSNNQLSMFINSKLDGQYAYYIDHERKKNSKGLYNMHIKRLEDFPQGSSARSKEKVVKHLDSVNNVETIKISEEVTETVEDETPPPPTQPANMGEMSYAQIRRWLQKNDSRKLRAKDIHINRTAEEVVIEIQLKSGKETLQYKLKK